MVTFVSDIFISLFLPLQNENILLEEDEKTVEDVPLNEGCHLLLEIRNRDLSWPEEMNSLVATRNFRERSNTG